MTFRASPAAVAAARLDAPFSAGIELGPDACRAYDPRSRAQAMRAPTPTCSHRPARWAPGRRWPSAPTATRRVSRSGGSCSPTPTPAQAVADLAGRMLLADQGISLRTEQPYATSVLQLTDATADGAELMLDVVPVDGASRRLQQALFARDLLFATCG